MCIRKMEWLLRFLIILSEGEKTDGKRFISI